MTNQDGWVGVGLLVTALVFAGTKGSRSAKPDEIVVVSVEPHRVGFASHQVVRSLSRGKIHDPRAIDRVEVVLGADDHQVLLKSHEVLEAAKVAARSHLGTAGWPRLVSQVFPRNHPRGPRYAIRVEVT